MIRIKKTGSFKNTNNFLKAVRHLEVLATVHKYGRMGVDSLSTRTPIDSGKTASSWYYEVNKSNRGYSLSFRNSNRTTTGIPIVILIQYGHGTRSGAYIQGRDFINPAIQPIFDDIVIELWKEVTSK